MDILVLLSLIIRFVATAWSLILLKRQKNWRFGLLAFILGLLFFIQLFEAQGGANEQWAVNEVQGLLIGVFSLLAIALIAALSRAAEQRKRVAEAAKRSELTYRGLFESADDAIVLVDCESKTLVDVNRAACQKYGYARDEMLELRMTDLSAFTLDTAGKILSVNRFGLEHLGYYASELIGQSVLTIIHEDDREAAHANLMACLQNPEKIAEWEFRKVRRNGRVVWVRVYARVKRNPDDTLVVLVVCDDITEHKQEEEQIRQFNLELEQRMIERTAQLQAANKELESFSQYASRDLRAPLRAISGFSEALFADYSDKLDAKGRDYLQRVRSASQRMAQQIDALLSLSCITRQEMRRGEVNLSEIAESVVAELRAAQPGREAQFIIEPNLRVNADPALMRILFANLLGNAWKYTATRERTRIEFGRARNNGTSVYFIRDNGVGFDPDFAEAMFIPFQRLHSLNDFEGQGIGLTAVHRIIQRHGGKVWATGQADKGATFFFTV